MIKFKYIFIVIGLIMSYCFQGQDISEETARMVAQNFISLKSEKNRSQKVQLINITNRIDKKYDGFYIFKNENGNGFYIISSESGNHPVLAYSLDSPLSLNSPVSAEFLYLLNEYQAANKYLRKNKANKSNNEQSALIKEEWEALLSGKKNSSDKNAKVSLPTSVSPLIKTTWNQAPYYNKFTPVTYEGKKTYTGCVATAMAQIMKFWNYPAKGNGTHTYTISSNHYDWKGKALTANFGNTTYLWNNMPNSLSGSSSTQQVDAVANLMLHAGISVNMKYSPNGSGAYTSSVVTALKNYFKYSSDITMKYRHEYANDSEWLTLVKEQVAKGYPVYFSGRTYTGGHAFIADGYDANNLIHFNLGWGGDVNGYYQITNPQGYSIDQAVIINISPFTSTCSAPTGLTATNISMNSATLKWNAVSSAQNYTVEYKLASATNWTVATASTTATSFNLSGLSTNSAYHWRVKTNCSASNSSGYTQSNFNTLINCSVPTGLSANVSTNSATLKWNAVSGAQNYTVEYKLTSATNWTVATASTTATSFNLSGLSTNSAYHWRVKTNCSASNSSGYTQRNFNTLINCSVPTGLLSANVSTNSATLKWNAVSSAQNYTVEYKLASATNWTVATASTTATSFNLSGLSANSAYHWRLKTNCSASNNSGYTQSNFNTLINCSVPTGLSANVSTNSATLKWNAVSGAQNYTVEYKLASATNWTVATASTTATSFNLSGLSANSAYHWRLKTNCSASNSSGYTQRNFNTLINCSVPTGLSANVSTNSATLKWNAVSGAQNYTVEYKLTSATNWTVATASTTATSFNLSGLSTNSAYHWRVKTNCSASNSSGYTQRNFTTSGSGPILSCINNYEPNESFATAVPISINTTYSAGIGSSTDKDYYKFTITGNSNVKVTLENLPQDYELKLYNSSQSQIGSSTLGGTSNETITINNLAPGTYYVFVYGYGGRFNLTKCYNLRVNATIIPSPCINNYEPNESFATAVPININTTYSAGIGSSTDKDYYKFTITGNSNVKVTLENLPKDYELKLYNSSQSQIGSSTLSNTSNETITINNLAPGTYYVFVYGYGGQFDLTKCYNLRVNATIIPSPCINNYEPNESFGRAVPININTSYSAGIGSSTDKDYYKFTITGNSNVKVTLENLPKDYELKLYNSSQSQIGSSTLGGTSNETITINNLAPGTYYVFVYGFNGQFDLTKCYNLRVNATIIPSPCINNYEPNESFATAVPININTTYSAGIGSSTDKDYYKFTITGNSNVKVTLENLPKDYELKLYNSSQSQIGSSTLSNTSNETITINNLAPGTYYVFVYGYGGQFDLTKCYNLRVNATIIPSPCINNYEPNESFGRAVPININTSYSAGIGSSTDKDYYKFTITGNSNVKVTLENLPKDYELKLYNSSQSQIGSSTLGGTSNETITINNLAPGTYYVFVYGFNGQFDLTKCYNLRVNSTSVRSTTNNAPDLDTSSSYKDIPITLYPNPVENTLYIKGLNADKDEYSSVSIVDRNGRIIKTVNIKIENTISIDVSDLIPNTYFIIISGKSFKFIKN